MTLAIYPETIPQYFEEDSFSITPPDNVVYQDMEVGPPKRTLRDTSKRWPINGTIVMTRLQYQTFENFYMYSILNGSADFEWVHPLYRTVATFNFTKKYDLKISDGLYEVTMSLEMLYAGT